MHPICYDYLVSLADVFAFYPAASAIALLLIGGMCSAIWFLPKSKKWRVIPLILLVSIATLFVYEPIKFELKMAKVVDAFDAEDWKKGRAFAVKNAATSIVAYSVPNRIARRCNSGFIVVTEAVAHTDSFGFTRGYPNSDEEYLRFNIERRMNRSCDTRAEIVTGSRSNDSCSGEAGRIKFFEVNEERSRSFEMKWCRRIQDDHAYCEADWGAVMLASGAHF